MLDTPTLQCNRVSFGRSAVVHNRQQILKTASIGHGAPLVLDHSPAINSDDQPSWIMTTTTGCPEEYVGLLICSEY